LNHLSIAITI